jgi:SAM-dependent methyltransferase
MSDSSTVLSEDAAWGSVAAEALRKHDELLRERVFQVKTKWPHFELLLKDIAELAETTPSGATVVVLERGLLYGGYSLLGPFFSRQNLISVDCSPATADGRGGYNSHMIDDDRFIAVPISRRASALQTGLESESADLVMVPNLVHHVADQDALFGEVVRLLRPGGSVYVFEPLVRELHQEPDDYLRYTPYGMKRVLEGLGCEVSEMKKEGSAFSAVAYCWTQALEYIPEAERGKMSKWFYEEHFPQLMQWDEQYPRNLSRKHTSFPMAFSLLGRKKTGNA